MYFFFTFKAILKLPSLGRASISMNLEYFKVLSIIFLNFCFYCNCTLLHPTYHDNKFHICLASKEPAPNMKNPSETENHIFCSRLLLFLNQVSARRELRYVVPGTLEPTTYSKSEVRSHM